MDRPHLGVAEPAHFRIYEDYAGVEPAFFDPDAFVWSVTLRENWRVIREEFERHVAGGGGVLRPNFAPDAVELKGWLGVNLFTCLRRNEANCRAFPRTVEVLESIPNLASAFINLLEPGSSLPPHFGDTNVCHRVHLGLIVPGGVEECGIEVDGEQRGWVEGDVLVFNDARRHRVWNRSARPRVILVCDIMKAEYGGATPRTCSRILGAIVVTYALSRSALLRRLPPSGRRVLHALASLPFRLHLHFFGMQRRRTRPA